MNEFVHLHVHTQYSLLDGANTIESLIEEAQRQGMPALAVTDHGNLFGAIEFYLKAKKSGIKPIIGCETYLAPQSRFKREVSPQTVDDAYTDESQVESTPYYHLILLAMNNQGYKNLIQLTSRAYLEGFYHKPRIDKELLAQYGKGLIATSSCLRGEIPFLLDHGKTDQAIKAAITYQEIFGKENFFIEIQENGLEKQKRINVELIRLANRLKIPLLATNDCHYLHRSDTRAHDILLCLQTGKTVNDPNRMRFKTDELYFKSSNEMVRHFSDYPSAITNTLEIAERCELDINFKQSHLPHYDVPTGYSLESYLKEQARLGLSQILSKHSGLPDRSSVYENRLREELTIINQMGYAGYFLVVWDIVCYARSQNIPVGPGRGSAAGSLVAYCLKITDIDPLSYGLIFERFLNPERVSLPDIDIDFCVDRRGKVIQYVQHKFGADHVAQIITFGTMAAKASIRDVGRTMEMPYAEVDQVAKLVPNVLNITLSEALQAEPKLRDLSRKDMKVGELLTMAMSLEGQVRHASTHAAGVVISREPLTEHVPLYKGAHADDEIVTQYAKDDLEKIGLIKFDFLGLRNLTVIDHAIKIIRENSPDSPIREPSDIPMDDAKTFTLLSSGKTMGVFQLESDGMRDLLVKMRPAQFEDLIAILALFRPGPIGSGMVAEFIKRKQGSIPIRYEVPQLEDILRETYGVIVYQEQVMKIANSLASFSLQEADLLRRAMGKKLPKEMRLQKDKFIEGAKNNGLNAQKAESIFDQMAFFAGYGFNKSHSAAYAMITFQTAYLKTHYLREFMAALLTSEMGNEDKIVKYLNECRDRNIKILPPDVNAGQVHFALVSEGIRFGLAAVKNVGENAIKAIVEAREDKGRFHSLFDFCCKVNLRKVNRRVLDNLIKSGAFDTVESGRARAVRQIERTLEEAFQYQKEQEIGQTSMFGPAVSGTGRPEQFGGAREGDQADEWDETERLKYEKESLGFYITSHPLAQYQSQLDKMNFTRIESLSGMEDGAKVRCCGVISTKRLTATRKGSRMAYLKFEDISSSVEVIVFPDLYTSALQYLESDNPLVITGTLDRREKGFQIKALRIGPLEVSGGKAITGITIIMKADQYHPQVFIQLKDILRRHSGSCSVHLKLDDQDQQTTIALESSLQVSPTESLIDELAKIYRRENILIQHG